jgi:peptide/nickel transport system substrate-binding protein
MPMIRRTLLAVGLALCLTLPNALSSRAETPPDMLVMAKSISDLITLDPAEVFELTGGEVIANIYDRVMMFEAEDLTTLVGGVVENYEVSGDGKTITFEVRPGQSFHSGNPVTAEDVEFSLRRVMYLNKTPAFILTQFGWNKDNVDQFIKATGPMTVTVENNSDFSAGLLLNALSAGVGSVVDKKTVMSHAKDGDFGYEWLKNHSAGSGPFSLKTWKANELVSLEANENHRHGKPAMRRVLLRHVPEPAAQRLLVEKGDADMARNLTPDQIKGLKGAPGVVVDVAAKAESVYFATNNSHPVLSDPKVRMALRYAVDYDGMANSFLSGQYKVHQSFWPSGLWASLEKNPFSYDLGKAKALLAEAGQGGGFKITIDTLTTPPFPEIAQSLQQSLSKIGIESEIILAEGKTLWPKYRARKHELIVARWSPDYVDPHSNADAFAHNPDNRLEAKLTGKPAWRTAWDDKEITALTEAAAKELDLVKRKAMYLDLQAKFQQRAPFNMMFQSAEQVARRDNVSGFVNGANFDLVFYRLVTKQ